MLARVSKYAFVVVWTRRFARPEAKALEKAADDRRREWLSAYTGSQAVYVFHAGRFDSLLGAWKSWRRDALDGRPSP